MNPEWGRPARIANLGQPSLFVSTGCTSSDVLLAPVLMELQRRGRIGDVTGVGGMPLRDLDVRLFFETSPFSTVGVFAGFRGMLRHGVKVVRAYRRVKDYFLKARPALAILVDNPGLNLWLLS